jgi:hypothetical protein
MVQAAAVVAVFRLVHTMLAVAEMQRRASHHRKTLRPALS